MTKPQAENIIRRFGGEIRENYSGREMYGRTTWAVDVDSDEFAEFQESELNDFYSTDNMGLGFIIY